MYIYICIYIYIYVCGEDLYWLSHLLAESHERGEGETKSIIAADRLFFDNIEFYECDMSEHTLFEIARNASDRADFAVESEKADIAFSRAVKLANMRNVEAGQEFFPDIRT